MMKRDIAAPQTILALLFALLPFSSAFAIHFNGPLVVDNAYVKKHGSVIVGNFQGTSSQPAITVNTSSPIIIVDSVVQGPGDLIYGANVNLTVMDTTGTGTNPNVYGQQKGFFIHVEGAINLVVENNTASSSSFGVYVNGYRGNSTPGNTITILYNIFNNTDARPSDGNGGYFTTGEYNGHAIQLNQVQNTPNIEIGWNQLINIPGQSQCSDIINMYRSSGTSTSHILIHDNYLQGALPANPGPGNIYTGGGIITDGTSNDTAATATAFVDIYNNQLVQTANYGFSIAAGHDNTAYNNRAVSSGYLADGTFYPTTFGNGFNNYNNYNQPSTTLFNNTMQNNLSGLVRSTTAGGSARADYYLPSQSSSLPNADWQPFDAAHPTTTDEANELIMWNQKVTQQGITLGAS